MKRHTRATALIAIGLLAVPAAAAAKGKKPEKVAGPPTVTHTLKGDVASVDVAAGTVVVEVTKANKHARALVGRELTVSLAGAKLSVADVDGNGAAELADVQSGDAVAVQVRLPKRATLAGPVVARKLVDLTHPEEDEAEAPEAAPTPAP